MPSWPSPLAKKRGNSSSSSSKPRSGVRARSRRLVSARAVGAPAVRWTRWAHLAVDVGVRDHEVDEPRPPPLRVEDLAGEHQAVRDVGQHPRQHHGRDHRGDDADPHLGEGERSADPATTTSSGQQSDATGPRRSADDGDDRLRRAPDRLEQLGELAHALVLHAATAAWTGPCRSRTRGRCGRARPPARRRRPGLLEGLAQLGAQARDSALRLAGSPGSGSRRRATPPRSPLGPRSQPHPAGRWRPRGTLGADEHRPAAAGVAGPALRLPESARAGLTTTPFGLYVHVPFCATRCGYCDFNTYTSDELGPGANRSEYAGTAIAELRRAAETLGPDLPTVSTVFVGGGTPTLLPADDLAAVLAAARELFLMADDAEVTTEANPESVTPASLARLREAGFTRVSLGMQSAAEHVLAVLDRGTPPAARWRPPTRPAPPASSTSTSTSSTARRGSPTPTGRPPRRRPRQPGRPRERLRADRGGRHPPGPPDQPR